MASLISKVSCQIFVAFKTEKINKRKVHSKLWKMKMLACKWKKQTHKRDYVDLRDKLAYSEYDTEMLLALLLAISDHEKIKWDNQNCSHNITMSFLQKIEIRIEKWQRIIHKQSLLDVERLLWRSDNRKYQNTAKKTGRTIETIYS